MTRLLGGGDAQGQSQREEEMEGEMDKLMPHPNSFFRASLLDA